MSVLLVQKSAQSSAHVLQYGNGDFISSWNPNTINLYAISSSNDIVKVEAAPEVYRPANNLIIVDGAGGTDELSFADANGALVVDMTVLYDSQNVGYNQVSYSNEPTTVASARVGQFHEVLFSNFENITGTRFNDQITGDQNANVLDGGAGNDTLKGGGGADTFKLTSATGVDTILDFYVNQDKIALPANRVGNFDTNLDNAVIRTGTSFSTTSELVIVAQNVGIDPTSMNTTVAAAAIGSASSAYAYNDHRIFTVQTWGETFIYEFSSANSNSAVEAAELTLIGVTAVHYGGNTLNTTDFTLI